MVRQLSPWFENLGKRQVKSPKVYIADTGLLHVDGCTGGVVEKVMAVVPEDGREWAQQHGLEVAPTQPCTAGGTFRPAVCTGERISS